MTTQQAQSSGAEGQPQQQQVPSGGQGGAPRPGGGGGYRRGPMGAGGPGGKPRFFARRKVCSFCVNHATHVDYKDVGTLKRYFSDQAKIESRRKSGVCSKHQRMLALAVKRARFLGMLPYNRVHRTGGARSFS